MTVRLGAIGINIRYFRIVRPPCTELVRVSEVIYQMIVEYVAALRGVASIGRWEVPQEGIALGWLLIRNAEAIVEMTRHDEVFVTAAWSNARVAFELGCYRIGGIQTIA